MNLKVKGRLLTVAIPTVLFLLSLPANGTMYIVFRYDDLSADKPGVRETNTLRRQLWDAEQKMDTLFEKFGKSYVAAIIPQPNSTVDYSSAVGATYGEASFGEDREKVELIKRGVLAGRIEVAQHGFSHINHSATSVAVPKRRLGEFRERDYESQLRDIMLGKEILRSSCDLDHIATFVPPWQGWDNNTAKVLKQAGFTILSADRFFYYKSANGLTLIPCTTSIHKLEALIHKGALPEEGLVVVLFHPKQIAKLAGHESQFFGINRLDELLHELSMRPDVEVVTFEYLAKQHTDLTIQRYRLANSLVRHRYFWNRLLPETLKPGVRGEDFYLSSDEYSKLLWRWRAVAGTGVILLAGLGFVIRRAVKMLCTRKWHLRVDIIATALFLVSVVKEVQILSKGYHITAVSAIPALLTLTFVSALLIQAVRRSIGWTERIVCKPGS